MNEYVAGPVPALFGQSFVGVAPVATPVGGTIAFHLRAGHMARTTTIGNSS
jgi:hypothetical protein